MAAAPSSGRRGDMSRWGGGGGEGRRWERVTTKFHSYSPPATPFPPSVRSPDARMEGVVFMLLLRSPNSRSPKPPLPSPSSFIVSFFFLFLFLFFRRGEPLACFSRGIGFPLFWCFVGGRLIKAQAAARVWATGHFGRKRGPDPPAAIV